MIECRTCKAQVSANAAFCPKCGEREPNSFVFRTSAILTTIGFIGLLIFVLIMFLNSR